MSAVPLSNDAPGRSGGFGPAAQNRRAVRVTRTTDRRVASAGITDPRIVAAMRLAEARPDVPMTTAALARAVGLSQFHFLRLFHAQTGETVSEYVRRTRLDAAAARLRRTSESIVSIALSIGYGSQAAFTRAFTTRFDCPPALYRRSRDDRPDDPVDARGPSAVTLRWLKPLTCLGRRYLGAPEAAAERWHDFLCRLPPELGPDAGLRYVGIFYDDPRVTPADQLRHDCCVALPVAHVDEGEAARWGLAVVRTENGLYAATPHEGPISSLVASYGLVLDRWLPAQSRYQFRGGDAGMLDIHAAPPGVVSAEAGCEVFVPVRANAAGR